MPDAEGTSVSPLEQEVPPPRTMLKKAAAALGVLLLLAAACATAYWQLVLEPYFLANKTRYGHMARIAEGIIGFSTEKGRLPTSLEEAVLAGHLPAEGPMYFSPMQHDTVLFTRSLPYSRCEYELEFRSDKVVIRVPEALATSKRFAGTKKSWHTLTVGRDVKLWTAPPTP